MDVPVNVLIGGDPIDRLCFDCIFRSPAFKTFLKLHTIGGKDDAPARLKLCRAADGEHGVEAAGSSIAAGDWVFPYTGIFVPRSGQKIEADSDDDDRDIRIEWCLFNGNTGMRISKECSGYIRGWNTPRQSMTLIDGGAAMLNHRCLHPNCAFTVVDMYVFFTQRQSSDADKKQMIIIYDEAAGCVARQHSLLLKKKMQMGKTGRKIDESGVLLPNNFDFPPNIPPNVTGDNIYLIGWPVVETLRAIPRREQLNVNYGDGYVAVSPHLLCSTTTECSERRLCWDDAKRGDLTQKFCHCEDCLALTDISERSVFLPP